MEDNLEKEAFIFGEIFILANRLQVMGDKFDEKISLKQWGVLAAISKFEGYTASVGQVADYIGSSGQNVKKMAVILERKGFLMIKADDNDARIVKLTLTPMALAHAKSREERELVFLKTLYQDFSEELLDGLYNGLHQLSKNINELEKGK